MTFPPTAVNGVMISGLPAPSTQVTITYPPSLLKEIEAEFRQQVALKLLKRGVDTDEVVRRFEQERQILAAASHPDIARLLDAVWPP